MNDFKHAIQYMIRNTDPEPRKRVFGGLKRGDDSKFPDDGLAKILLDATNTPGGAWRARGTPGVFRILEILGIQQARQWGVCTMNEFRKFLGLKPFEKFEEWNSDAEIAVWITLPINYRSH
jgi:linoleate 10R-lipoxygenase